MEYKKIRIKNYASIFDVELEIKKSKIVPILGLNGSGKSNILKAINDFVIGKEKTVKSRKNVFIENNAKTFVSVSFKNIEKNVTNDLKELVEDNYKSPGAISNADKEIKEILLNIISEIESNDELNVSRVFTQGFNYEPVDFTDLLESKSGIELSDKTNSVFTSILNYYQNTLPSKFPKIKYFSTIDFVDFFEEEILFENTDSIEENYKLKIIDNIIKKTTIEKYDLTSYNKLENGDTKNRVTLQIQNEFNDILKQDERLNELNGGIKTEIRINISAAGEDSHQNKISFKIIEDHLKEDDLLDNENRKEYNANYGSDGFRFMLNYYISILFENDEDGTIFLFDEPTNFVADKMISILYTSLSKLFSLHPKSSAIITTHNPFGLNWKYLNPNDVLVLRKAQMETKLENINKFISECADSNETLSYIDKLFKASGLSSNSISYSPTKTNILVEGITDWRIFNSLQDDSNFNFIFMNGYSDVENLKPLLSRDNVYCILDKNKNGDEEKAVSKFLKDDFELKNKVYFLPDLIKGAKEIEDLIDADEFKTVFNIDKSDKKTIKQTISKSFFETELKLNSASMPKTSLKINEILNKIKNCQK